MKLVVGKRYRDRWDNVHEIMGPTKDYKAQGWVWSNKGNWYVQTTGQFVSYIPGRGIDGHVPLHDSHPLTLTEEVKDDELQD